MHLVDFNKCKYITTKGYVGANGKKRCYEYNGVLYMVKYPTVAKKNNNMHYSNGVISEYLGCHIFNSIGIPAQETILGTFDTAKGKQLVVGCYDLEQTGKRLDEFAKIKNTVLDSEGNGYGTELSDIELSFIEQEAIDPIELKRHFWNMFVVDALIGNWDRHNGNWGFLYDPNNNSIEIAPIYDCGSSLFPQADDEIINKVFNDVNELNLRVYQIPSSAIEINGKRLNYYAYINSCSNDDLNEAILRIVPKIDLDKINIIIDDIDVISDNQKEFYKLILESRYDKILVSAYEKLINKDKINSISNKIDEDAYNHDNNKGYEM